MRMRPPRLLVDAAISYLPDGEDRLTELLAVALTSHPGFLRAFAERVGLPEAERYDVTTQYWANTETRIDMRLTAHDGAGTIGAAYIENKIDGYWFSETQIDREKNCLQREHARCRRFACIVSSSEFERLSADALVSIEDFDAQLRWADVAELANSTGQDWPSPWGGASWTESALRPEAPAAQRVLYEFIAYLGEDEMPDQISVEDVQVLSVADDILETFTEFLEKAAFSAKPWEPYYANARGSQVVYRDSVAGRILRCVSFAPRDGHWLAETEEADITLALDPGVSDRAHDEGPIVCIGPYLNKTLADQGRADLEWLKAAARLEFAPISYPSGLWLCRTVLLKHFVVGATSYEQQTAQLGQWINAALDALDSLSPPASDGVVLSS
jgi:hypothetical protein